MDVFVMVQDGSFAGFTIWGWWLLWAALLSPLTTVSFRWGGDPDVLMDTTMGMMLGISLAVLLAGVSHKVQQEAGWPVVFVVPAILLLIAAGSVLAWHLAGRVGNGRRGE